MTDTPQTADEMTTDSADSTITDVIFDFCGVLIDWQCRACLEGHFPDDLVDEICADDDPYGFYRYEDHMDSGEEFADLIVQYREEFGDDMAKVFTYYIAHYADSLPRMVPGMEELLTDLRDAGIGAWGLTNWSHETFHTAFDRFPQLEAALGGTVVSGFERKRKPNADIYELTMQRFGLQAAHCVFFDDTARNVNGANAVGIHGLPFTDADTARRDLQRLGVRI
ncbi:HAD family hydrolase [Bifidobacterium tibiigranuli]|jgi:HAD superfamily hydrolase (TIGR01509 family)|uniref:HAD family hydrolase n=1 Tax=Bifidobacterium tibiigranuli TaxID=2172043 RepID=UPI0026EB1AB7|nr:HAD family phosphatase [Bifidobacterium tibiigranuli]MCI1649711.1 HAD family phosphatase [Bifidobacterium tibiigranuli]MCI1673503.1 HAD family phosphatase [Bifidobacterium tibiigranuli]MCI1712803.1 HAD family phosphatase [Bifidobacterium tibiigranuli]MCI1833494.1 HAD family phosphatase [Bifidobacterium tibiigranuli]MCI2185447.1 HAD family phosphatase [Bifidobacterium tibiigranuli]